MNEGDCVLHKYNYLLKVWRQYFQELCKDKLQFEKVIEKKWEKLWKFTGQ